MGFNNWKLRHKIMLPTSIVVVVILALSIFLMAQRAQQLALEQAVEIANEQALSYGRKIKTSLEEAMAVSRTLQSVFNAALRLDPVPPREYFDAMLKDVLLNHPSLSGTWIACLPNTFDNREEECRAVWKGNMRVYHCRDGEKIKTVYGGVEKLGGDWFDIPMAGTIETISKPYPWEVDGKTNWLCSTGFPIQKDGKNIGVIGVDFYLTELQEMVKSISPFEVGYGFLSGSDGAIIAHPDDALVGKSLGDIVDPEYRQAYLDAVAKGKKFAFTSSFDNSGEEEYVTEVPITIGSSPTTWSLSVVIPLSAVKRQARSVANTGIVIGVAAIIVLLVLLYVLSHMIIKPVLQIAQYTEDVAKGELDAPMDINQADEIGLMAESLKIMVGKLKVTLEAERKTREAESESARASQAMIKAENARMEAVRTRNEALMQTAERIADVLQHVKSASSEMRSQSEELLTSTEKQSERIYSTATAMEKMNATVLDIARNAGDASSAGMQTQSTAEAGSSVVDQSKTTMHTTMSEVGKLNDNMRKLDEKAQSIGDIIGVINDIADQTNLLALNAAIEAARAGEAGRGFAVVADEVRKLAEKTMQATKEVSVSIGAIQKVADANKGAVETVVQYISKADELSNQSGEMLQEIVKSAEHSAGQIASIATAAEQQSSTSEEINGAIERISVITNQTADSAREFTRALRLQEEQIIVLNEIVEDLREEGKV